MLEVSMKKSFDEFTFELTVYGETTYGEIMLIRLLDSGFRMFVRHVLAHAIFIVSLPT